MPFFDAFVTVRTQDGHDVITLSPLTYVTKAGESITIPIGTRSDGASVPQALWGILPPFGTYYRACLLHDYLYRNTARPREECDAILLEAMESSGVSEWECHAIYEGVRLGGSWAFAQDRGHS